MYRLRSLDTNVSAIINPPPKPSPKPGMPLVDASLAEFIAGQPKGFTHVAVAAAVFHEDRMLLVQRAESDSYPGHWELPGGSADPTDKSISEAVARELFEETGLKMKHVVQEILPPTSFFTGWGKRAKTWLKVSFLVEVTAESDIKAEEEVKEQKQQGEEMMRKDSFIAASPPAVKLNPKEHQKHLWLTAEEVIKNEVQRAEGALKFISDDNVATLLEAFSVHKKMQKARAAEVLQEAAKVDGKEE